MGGGPRATCNEMRRGRWEHAPSCRSSSPLCVVGSEVGGGRSVDGKVGGARGGKGAIACAPQRAAADWPSAPASTRP
ncbi:Os01g0169700 [Oryza sativa Japonica Group]|uniref:Os01g0169700 protein n=1 Tax=Oryza sativa subsp. japonica TaxID=39947 RepID=A0A0P0UYV3_ORYSJ|nr:Os01g0169700 [Oryza sativa Japonica Group]